jgi:hypothetical protein
VMELWFSSRGAVRQFFAEDAYFSVMMRYEAACVDIANIRAVVAKICVIHDEFSFQPSITQPLEFSWDE